MFFKRKNKAKLSGAENVENKGNEELKLSIHIDKSISVFKTLFEADDTIIYRRFENQKNSNAKFCIIFAECMINAEIINEHIIQPTVSTDVFKTGSSFIEMLNRQVILSSKSEISNNVLSLVDSILSGDTVLLVDGSSEAMIISSKGWQTRSVEEPETERVLRGPREGFTESLLTNISLVRRKLKTNDLKFMFRFMGSKSNTKICICYLRGAANPEILKELLKRFDSANLEAVLDSGYIQEFIGDAPCTPFKTIGSTERPDTIAGKLLEGRIAVLVDGSPVAITLPYIFIENFQFNDDYYVNFYFSSIGRLIRIIGFFFTISVPAIYIALVTFHQEMIPTPLIMNISAAREGIPFPTIIEALGMLLIFEILRETGLRMPTFMGQALSIVGALVIGQAAVDAKFISAPMVIIIAFTGITGLMIPKLKGAVILIRTIFILLASILGLYGYLFGVAGLLVHLIELRTFGIPYLYRLLQLDPSEELKDTAVRAPWWLKKKRPRLFKVNEVKRKPDRSGST